MVFLVEECGEDEGTGDGANVAELIDGERSVGEGEVAQSDF